MASTLCLSRQIREVAFDHLATRMCRLHAPHLHDILQLEADPKREVR